MEKRMHAAVEAKREEILAFVRELVSIRSVTGQEAPVAAAVEKKLRELGFDDVQTDRTGNVIGSVGTGATTILFDGHMDTVDVIDEDRWTYPPFSGQIADGNMYGRGTVDMKGALAVSIYAAAIARDLGLLDGRKVYVAGSVMEEDYDGVAVHNLLRDLSLRPDYVIFGEATGMEICRGHNGRALIEITVHGKAAHGSRPELGINPVYRQQAVVARIEALAAKLSATPGEHGTLSLTNVKCVTASNNSVPESSSIVLDRRLCITENRQTIEQEMAFLLDGVDAEWKICDIPGVSWTGQPVLLRSYLPAWEIPEDSRLVQKAKEACRIVFDKPYDAVKLVYTTDAVATAGELGIPTIVLGPGDSNCHAHGTDEYCPVEELIRACEVYVQLCASL